MLIEDRKTLDRILTATADALDIPDHIYEDATIKYEDVSEHLGASDSPLAAYYPEIYVQGSFRLGTVVRPVDNDGDYDIDQVCRLKIKKQSITQADLKKKIGDRLKVRDDFKAILKESRRCWTLEYPQDPAMPGFHLDILPSIPHDERLPNGILLSDKELHLWQKSNPIFYADWFKERMAVVFLKRATFLAESIGASIEDVPEWRVKTPLQRIVQILKRHRDTYFADNTDNKPVSIIITTLAGHAYQNEEDLFDALESIVKLMPSFIENHDGVWWVQNPVDEDENFADKWNEYPERREAFLNWLRKVQQDFTQVSKAPSLREGIDLLNESIGEATMNKVASDLDVQNTSLLPAIIRQKPSVPAIGNTNHALDPRSKFQIVTNSKFKVRIIVGVYLNPHGKRLWQLADRPVPKNIWLRFSIKTNVPEPYTVKWQVTNSGDEADNAGQLRGDFYDSEDSCKRVRWESTAYRGTHWVRAFIFNNQEICVAESPITFVKIR